jgi:acetolactate synthase-1/2/3 large subunit
LQALDKTAHEWLQLPDGEVGDAIVAALAAAGVEYLFFTSGSELAFYQEAIAKAEALGRPTPRLVTMIHEHASLNAALGYAAVSGKPVATAAHADAGTFNYGGALHTAAHANLPIFITGGGGPTAYTGTVRGARDRGGHLWFQQPYDQNGIVRDYVKWEKRLEYADNPGLIVSRGLQVALTEPRGPVYFTPPRELTLAPLRDTSFPTAQQLGIPETPAPAIESARDIARKLIGAENPFVVTSTAGRNPATVPALVKLCELLAMPVANSGFKAYHCFPKRHPLYLGDYPLKEADVVVAIDANVPWTPGPKAPPASAYVAVVDIDPVRLRIPTYEFTADVRVTSDALRAIELLTQLVEEELTPAVRAKVEARRERWQTFTSRRRAEWNAYAESKANDDPIDPAYVTYELAKVIDDNCIVFDETLQTPMIDRYVPCNVPGSYFHNPASSGGWSIGAAFGAKMAAPDKDIIACTGDGFYQYSTATAALWAAVHFAAPFMAVVYQNRSYSTGTVNVGEIYPGGYAFKAGYEGGHFDPPVDFAKEAEAAGAHGENVRTPAEVGPAMRRAKAAVRAGKPAIVSVWLQRLGGSELSS